MVAYSDYAVSKSRLDLLRSQERSAKSQVEEFEGKIRQIEEVNLFVSRAGKLGLEKKQWDRFSVNIEKEPVSFEKLQEMLFFANHSDYYYFLPESLLIRTGSVEPDADASPGAVPLENSPGAISSARNEAAISQADATLSLKGLFLARRPEKK